MLSVFISGELLGLGGEGRGGEGCDGGGEEHFVDAGGALRGGFFWGEGD